MLIARSLLESSSHLGTHEQAGLSLGARRPVLRPGGRGRGALGENRSRSVRREEHDRHFLSRLDRVEDDEVAFALSLYRDHQLVRLLLAKLSLADGVHRVALALSEGPNPPHVIVQRDGRFITCLGPGMKTHHPVVSKATIDATLRRFEYFRGMLRACDSIPGAGTSRSTLRKLFLDGRYISREEATPIFQMAPLIEDKLYQMWIDCTRSLVEGRRALLRQKKIGARLDPILETWWQMHWAHANLSVAAFLGGARFFEGAGTDKPYLPCTLSSLGMSTGSISMMARGHFASAKAGRRVLPSYKVLYRQSGAQPIKYGIDCLLGLLAIGLRHKNDRAEIKKLLATRIEMRSAASTDLFQQCAGWAAASLDDDSYLRECHRDAGRRLAVELGQKQPVGSELRFERVEDVPDELAFPLALQTGANVHESFPLIGELFKRTAYAATAAPEDLYLPSRYLPLVRQRFHRGQAIRLLDFHRAKPSGGAGCGVNGLRGRCSGQVVDPSCR